MTATPAAATAKPSNEEIVNQFTAQTQRRRTIEQDAIRANALLEQRQKELAEALKTSQELFGAADLDALRTEVIKRMEANVKTVADLTTQNDADEKAVRDLLALLGE